MNDTKFTPGPWACQESEHCGDTVFYIAQSEGAPYTPHYSDVAQTCHGERVDVQRANAHMLAAAPDFYAELYDLLPILEHNILKHQPDSIDNNHYYSIENRLKRIQYALSKARGEAK